MQLKREAIKRFEWVKRVKSRPKCTFNAKNLLNPLSQKVRLLFHDLVFNHIWHNSYLLKNKKFRHIVLGQPDLRILSLPKFTHFRLSLDQPICHLHERLMLIDLTICNKTKVVTLHNFWSIPNLLQLFIPMAMFQA